MKTLTFTEFRQNATACLNAVEEGETFRILRHGKPVADLKPIGEGNTLPSWKRKIEPIKLREGLSASKIIIEERDEYER